MNAWLIVVSLFVAVVLLLAWALCRNAAAIDDVEGTR